jgi:hypothetical protein
MLRPIVFFVAAALTIWAGLARAADEPTLRSVSPVVVKTEPRAGASDVPAGASEIRIKFSKKMRDKSWSWVMMSLNSFPKMAGDPHFSADLTTCILPVTLEAGKTYAMWINSEGSQNFQDADGHEAVPYLLVFSTK